MAAKQTPESFWAKVDIRGLDECWNWTRSKNSTGYGTVGWHGKGHTAHRIAAYLSGLVPTMEAPTDRKGGGFILHQCDNPLCCNPAHFKIGTYGENQQEAYDRDRRSAAPIRGSAHKNSRLTDEDVQSIRELYKNGVIQKKLAETYGVSQKCISLVVRKESYV